MTSIHSPLPAGAICCRCGPDNGLLSTGLRVEAGVIVNTPEGMGILPQFSHENMNTKKKNCGTPELERGG